MLGSMVRVVNRRYIANGHRYSGLIVTHTAPRKIIFWNY